MDGMMKRGRMDSMMGVGVGNRRRCGMDGMVRYRVYRRGDGLAVLVQDWLGQEGVEERVSIESVQRRGLGTVNRVPGLTSEQVLVKESPIGTDKAGTVGSVSPILTDSVGLTAGLRVCVHSWAEGGGGAGELGVRSLRQAGVVLAGVAGHSVLVVVGLVVRLWVIRGWSRVVGGLGVIWSRSRVVRRLWRMVGSWFMIGGSGGNIWS